jgi:hypothetical protein
MMGGLGRKQGPEFSGNILAAEMAMTTALGALGDGGEIGAQREPGRIQPRAVGFASAGGGFFVGARFVLISFFADVCLLKITATEVAPLGQVIERAAEFVRGERFSESAGAKGPRIFCHSDGPGRGLVLTEGWKKARLGEKRIEIAAPCSTAAKLTPYHAALATLLIERNAIRIARLRENADTQMDDFAGASGRIEADDGGADRGGSDIEAVNQFGSHA